MPCFQVPKLRRVSSVLLLLVALADCSETNANVSPPDSGDARAPTADSSPDAKPDGGDQEDVARDRADAALPDGTPGDERDVTLDVSLDVRSSDADASSQDSDADAMRFPDADASPPPDADASPPPDADATTPEDADVTSSPDGDGSSCTCTTTDPVWNPGTTSLPCFCQAISCLTYDVAVAQCPTVVFETSVDRLVLNDYAACNLVSVERQWGLDHSIYVYNATTHELVGASYSTDTPRFACGSSTVWWLQGGVLPASSCSVTSTTLCAMDAGSD
jgi:hypothetical protein